MSRLSPSTLTTEEQKAILRFTADHPRDHVIFSLALGTGLRLAELVGLNCGDVYGPNGIPKIRLRVRAEIAKGHRAADVFLPDKLVPKLKKLWAFKVKRGESLDPGSPLFCNQSRRRMSTQRVANAWKKWQVKAGLDRHYCFHSLRHSAVTNVYRASRDLFLAQRFARHASPLTTVIYTHPSDQEMASRLRGLPC